MISDEGLRGRIMSLARRAKRRVTRPDIRRGSSAIVPARPSAKRITAAESLSLNSDRLMWWGWGVAIAFVIAGLAWHVITYQPSPNMNASKSAADDQLVECNSLERE
jgi:hypothetical protein